VRKNILSIKHASDINSEEAGQAADEGFAEFLKDKNILAETEGNFWLCVAEDLNMIVFYACVFHACNSQISVHDDTATLSHLSLFLSL
jgi:hypothetical protein